MSIKLVYFAWVRERIGLSEEMVDLPHDVTNAASLIAWLSTRGEGYAYALEVPEAVRVAVDQQLVDSHAEGVFVQAREIALFPPMTGG